MNIRITRHSLGGAICVGMIAFICSGTQAQNLFVSAQDGGNIYEFTSDGRQSTFASGLNDPIGLAFDSAGNLFVAGLTNIYELTPSGVLSNFVSVFGPYGLAFNRAGHLFASGNASGDIYEFTPDGAQSTFASGLYYPAGLAFNGSGDLFVADSGSGNVYEFDTNGIRTTFASGLVNPVALAFDSAGNLFVANGPGDGPPDWGSIYEFTTSGVQTTFASGNLSFMFNPRGLAFNSAGDLFAPNLNSDIYEFAPDGAQSTFASSNMGDVVGLVFQPVPVLVAVGSNNVLQITVTMPSPYYSTIVQASTNLVDWVNVCTNIPPFTLTNSMVATSPFCFYRAVLGP